MTDLSKNIEALREKKAVIEMGGGEAAIEKQVAMGKLTARERILALLDKNSFHEYDMFVKHDGRDFGMEKKVLPGDGVGEDFCIFWEKFHDITEHPKVNIGRARREWKKLTAGEKQRALDNIDEYYDHLNNQKYCKQAATYLADKSFENEYDD